MRAEVEAIDVCALGREQFLKSGMYLFYITHRVESLGDAALVGDNDDADAGFVEAADCFHYAGENLEFTPSGYVCSLWHLAINDPVAVEKARADARYQRER